MFILEKEREKQDKTHSEHVGSEKLSEGSENNVKQDDTYALIVCNTGDGLGLSFLTLDNNP